HALAAAQTENMPRARTTRGGAGTAPPRNLVAPVEVAGAIDLPETGVLDRAGRRRRRVRDGLLAGPGKRRFHAVRGEGRLDAVHRLLDPRLLFGLEERMVLERILVLVAGDRHMAIELRVPFLQLEVILDHLREQRRCLYRHTFLRVREPAPSSAGHCSPVSAHFRAVFPVETTKGYGRVRQSRPGSCPRAWPGRAPGR